MIQKLKYLVVGLLSVLFSLLIIEIVLRFIDTPVRPVSGWNDCKKPKECNYMGFRGREIAYSANDFVVVLVGDSKLAAWSLPFDQIPELRLEHFLKKYKKNVKVITLGTHGYGQDQEFLALEKYFEKHRADLVLLFYSFETDIEDNIFPVSGQNNTIKPTFWLENGELRGPSEGWLEPVGPERKLALLWKSYIGQTEGEARLEKWKKDILPLPYQPLKKYQGEVDNTLDELWKLNPKETFVGIEFERGIGFVNQLTPRSEMRQYGINLSRKLFFEIEKLTEANRGHFVIFKDELPWEVHYSEEEKVHYLNGKYYKLSMRQYQDTLQDIFDGFEYYRIPLDMDNYTVSKEDMHLNQRAFDILFEKLSQIISKKDYFK